MANKHYLQVPESEFERAAQGVSGIAVSSQKAVQNPVQHTAVSAYIDPQAQKETLDFSEKSEGVLSLATSEAPRAEPSS